MKFVIQSCTGYEEPLKRLMLSIDFKRVEEDIIVVMNNSDTEKIEKHMYNFGEQSALLTTLYTPKNIWEWVSFEKIGQYWNHPAIKSEYYLFLHDTCWAGDADKFWAGVEKFKNENPLRDMPRGFCYPFKQAGGFNMGWGRSQFVKEFGAQFVDKTFNKKEGILLEHCARSIKGIHGIKKWPYAILGPKQRLGGPRQVYSNIRRKVNYIPLLDLYKAYNAVPWRSNQKAFLTQRYQHPNKP